MAITQRKELLLGTNQYPNFNEHIKKEINSDILYPENHKEQDAVADTLKPYRGAMAFERLRYKTDQYAMNNKRPSAFMFTYGNLAKRRARSQFSCNFFACAGFEVIDNPGFKSIQEGIQAYQQSKAEIVVLCSSDDEYKSLTKELFEKIKNKKIVVIAGYPKNSAEVLNRIRIEHFIHVKSNIINELKKFNRILNIKNTNLKRR